MGISDINSTSNLEVTIDDLLGLWIEPQISSIPVPLAQAPLTKQISSV